jgi:threonine/homoserine/homoserine lactone efflux protein
LGNTTGVFVQAIAVALGLGVVVERSVAVFTVIKLAGAAYLVFLGVRAIRERRSLSAALDQKIVARPTRQIIREGFWVGLGNPKAAIFFAAILPQFVDRHRGNVPVQMIMLGLVFSAIAMVSDSAWGLLAGTARQWFARSPRRLEAVGGAGGLVIIGLGVRLALIGRQD